MEDIQNILDTFNDYKKAIEVTESQAFNQVFLYGLWAVGEIDNSQLYILASILDDTALHSLIDFYDGDTITIPTKEQRDRGILLAQIFYMREHLGQSWSTILDFYQKKGIKIEEPGKMKYKVTKMRERMNRDIEGILRG